MQNSYLKQRALDDLKIIFDQLISAKFVYNNNFSEGLNKDLEEVIVTDILMPKFDIAPETKTVIGLSQWDEPIIKKKWLSKNVKVIIKGTGDSYWMVAGEKSSIPGEVETTRIRENYPAEYILEYQKNPDGKYTLVNFEDDNGQYLGTSRTWGGRKELMEKYRANPDIINQ
ncbi:hypothetical protein ACFL21_04555 [Patescibacteria group bacterium]